jgi:hypothetical protein
MSWATFKTALVSKVAAVEGTGRVYSYWPLSSDAPTHPSWQSLFLHEGVFNFWSIQRTGYLEEISVDDETVTLVTHEVSITALRALKLGADAESAFQAALDAVSASFRTGPRTLGGLVNTYSVPDFQSITEVSFQKTVSAYKAESSFLVEEILRA